VTPEDDALVTAATSGDETAFGTLAERYRRELRVHCYRMLGSFEESEAADVRGATSFTFVTEGFERAVEPARGATGAEDVGLHGAAAPDVTHVSYQLATAV
jgi:hypothetical protein